MNNPVLQNAILSLFNAMEDVIERAVTKAVDKAMEAGIEKHLGWRSAPLTAQTSENRGRYLSSKEAGAYLSQSTSSLAKLRVIGGGPPYVKFGSKVRYDIAVLDAWMAERTYSHTSQKDAELSIEWAKDVNDERKLTKSLSGAATRQALEMLLSEEVAGES